MCVHAHARVCMCVCICGCGCMDVYGVCIPMCVVYVSLVNLCLCTWLVLVVCIILCVDIPL